MKVVDTEYVPSKSQNPTILDQEGSSCIQKSNSSWACRTECQKIKFCSKNDASGTLATKQEKR